MELYIIRHGKTEANEKRLYCGSTDEPLSKQGRRELALIDHDIDKEKYRFITSGTRRTDETFEILFGNIPFEKDEGFREIDFGIFEMKSYEELKNLPEYQKWISGDNEANVIPDGESGNMLKKRVLKALDNVLDMGKDTVLITHGGVIAVIMQELFGDENKNRYEWQPDFGHGYKITRTSYKPI